MQGKSSEAHQFCPGSDASHYQGEHAWIIVEHLWNIEDYAQSIVDYVWVIQNTYCPA